ncbi:fatty acyl-AMP ligase [Streptomyces sp. 8K308]|uniref:fatty acyl-AMP ligase n=1 Tax=Streptomyces sp. 8K308 TaxID=2530388 RepID=UPI00105094D1|nr:fatty acyl-AMP ligase [Streptomyces sp. 8K308]TDC25344.1 fatty acyl-AMP ligase [Streptomyces sp. 8K308]
MTTIVPTLTLLSRLREHATRRPSVRACVFTTDDGEDEKTLTYADLDRDIRTIATGLRARLNPGDRALLLLPEGADFVRGFLGCMRAGVIPVPAYPPLPVQSRQRVETLRAIVADCGPRAVLSAASTEDVTAIRRVVPDLDDVWWSGPDELLGGEPDEAAQYEAGPDDVAFLQYTSGSTSSPKGVVVTHAALAHNVEMIRRAFGLDEEPRMASWLPLFHDMGLIGNVLHPLWAGGTTILMTPMTFLKRPARWLAAISRHRANATGAPNFAYELCTRRVKESESADLDLSSWRVAYNGAEPVRAASLDAFAERFAAHGFDPGAWWPCYGLAEATLLVTGGDPGREPARLTVDRDAFQQGRVVPAAEGTVLVSSGYTTMERTVLIVDPETREPVAPGHVGEIWIGGPHLPVGYWGNPQATEETFAARPVGGPRGPYMRSGDLGFVHDGELYVTGRCKDLLIVGGRNHYPQDIEATVEEAHDAIRKGCVAAFAIDDGDRERVVVVAGAGQGAVGAGEAAAAKRDAITRAATVAVAAEHGITLDDVAVVGPNAVPKTSSGKLRRGACRAAYLRGEYAVGAKPERTEDE